MTTKTLSLTSLASLFVFAAGFSFAGADAPREGSLRVTVAGSSETSQAELPSGRLTLNGVDNANSTSVALEAAAIGDVVRVALPPGVYSVSWQPGLRFDADGELELEAPFAATRLVVVAAERVSAVEVVVPPSAELESYALEISEVPPDVTLAMR